MAKFNNNIFVTLAPWIKNVDLCKDVGMIPYYFYKKYGFESIVVSSKNDNYSYLKSEVKGLQLEFITNIKSGIRFKVSIFLLIIKYLIKKSKEITILNLYHIRTQTAIWAILFKILNPCGKIYLKCDIDANGIIDIQNLFFTKKFINLTKKILLLKLLQKVDLITIETKKAFSKLEEFLKNININTKKCLYLPNGFYVDKYKYRFPQEKIWSMKENIVLSVGRVGTKQKNTEIILETFTKLDPQDWKLALIGPIEQIFKQFINDFFIKYPSMKSKIFFTGPIYDKNILYNWYCKSKIFYFPSRWEGFSLALIEAIFFMNYLVASKIDCTLDITNNGEYGTLVKIDDIESHIKGLDYAINLPKYKLLEITSKVRKKIEEKYNWDKIVDKIYFNLYPDKK